MNTHANERGNESVTINQFHTFANQIESHFNAIDRRFIELDNKFIRLDQRINKLDEKINQLRAEFLAFKEEMRLVHVKIAGWVAGSMIGSAGVIFGGFQLLRGLL